MRLLDQTFNQGHSLASFFTFARCLRLTLPSTMHPTVDHRAATPTDLLLLKRLQGLAQH